MDPSLPSLTCIHQVQLVRRGDLSEDRAAAFEERQAEVEALQRAVEALGEALGQAPPALAPITTARERGEGAISLIITKVVIFVLLWPACRPVASRSRLRYVMSVSTVCLHRSLAHLAHPLLRRGILPETHNLPSHQLKHADVTPHGAPLTGTQYLVQDHEDLSGGLFEDEDTRVFYEDLPNLRDLMPEVGAHRRCLLLRSLEIARPSVKHQNVKSSACRWK